jgi:hypothetical protein
VGKTRERIAKAIRGKGTRDFLKQNRDSLPLALLKEALGQE